MKKTTYITGHRHPDTDSIVASIAYSYLKNKLGENTVASRLGELNDETKYLLNRFQFDEPYLLKDARISLSEIDLMDPVTVNVNDTLFETLETMMENKMPFMGVEEDSILKGLITRNDIAHVGMGDTALGIDLLKQTPLKNICKTLDGKFIYEDEQTELNGKVSIVALSAKGARDYEVKNRIVIIGDDPDSQKQLIKKGAGLLIVVWAESIDPSVIELARQYHCSILISGHGSMNTSRYLYFSPPVRLLMKQKITTFYEYEYVEDVARKMGQYRFRAYPVINKENELLGYVLKDHVMNAQNKSIIMVDHNEFSQSVPNIEKADIKEVIDHHRIYDFYSSRPVSFRNEIIGSTSTIIASMYNENGVEIPKNIASILLGAILSDTLNFQSPTCTNKDQLIASQLEQICGLNSDELAYDMFFVCSNIANKSVSDFINEDVKYFDINHNKVMIAQVIVPTIDNINEVKSTIQAALDENIHRNGYDLGVLTFTSILENGSIFYFSGPLAQHMKDHYDMTEEGHTVFVKSMLSRKKQIVPSITKIIEAN